MGLVGICSLYQSSDVIAFRLGNTVAAAMVADDLDGGLSVG